MAPEINPYANPPEDITEVEYTDEMVAYAAQRSKALIDSMIAEGINFHLIPDYEFIERGLEVPERE